MDSTVSLKMMLKPNYLRGFLTSVLWIWSWTFFFSIVVYFLQGESVEWLSLFKSAGIGGILFGVFVCVVFTPREIKWDEEGMSLNVIFPESGSYTWQQLESYSLFGSRFGLFLIKFEGEQAYQIFPFCFSGEEWKGFQTFLRTRYPNKKAWLWFGHKPIK